MRKSIRAWLVESRTRHEGSVLVELAFAIPIMTLLMVVIVDVGLIVREHQVIQNAAREGARYSCLPENWVSPVNPSATIAAIQQKVVDYAAGEGIVLNVADVTVDQAYPIPISGGLTAYGSEVTVTYTRRMLIGAFPLLPTNSMTLTGRSLFRNLY
jgi:Flp pilus assembly protein TadG